MTFRLKRDEWHEFLKRHGNELRACGVPDVYTRDGRKLQHFLTNEIDELDLLTPEQTTQLATLVLSHFGEGAGLASFGDLQRRAHSPTRADERWLRKYGRTMTRGAANSSKR